MGLYDLKWFKGVVWSGQVSASAGVTVAEEMRPWAQCEREGQRECLCVYCGGYRECVCECVS